VNAAINFCECSNEYLWMQQLLIGSAAIENREW